MKRLICLLLAMLIVLSSTVAFAEALRVDPKAAKKGGMTRGKPDDYFYEDFTGVETGTLPKSVSAGAGVSTEYVNGVLPKLNKNCLVLDDTSHDNSYGGPSTNIVFGKSYDGQVRVEIRYKYIPTGGSNWSAFVMMYQGAQGMLSRTVVASANGSTNFNYGGNDSSALESSRVAHDTWYTLTYIIDFDEGTLAAYLKNEGTGVTTKKTGASFYDSNIYKDINRININSQVYGGKWYIDYIRVCKNTEEIIEEDEPDIVKGVPAVKVPSPVNHAVAGRINVSVDGKIKYTSTDPVIGANGGVLVSAKNVAKFLGMSYVREDSTYTLKKGTNEIIIVAGSSEMKTDSGKKQLSETTVEQNTQLFIPIKDAAEYLGYEYNYNKADELVSITTPAPVEEAEEVEE